MGYSISPARLSFLSLLGNLTLALAQTLPAPGQPPRQGTPGAFELIGSSLVSAQQIFLGTKDKVYFIDKVEGNPTQINGHPAWASEWALSNNTQRAMDAMTNTFCAGGNVLGNGTWINVGGNQAVTYGGEPAASQNGGGAYDDPDGRQSLLDPCDDGSCDWVLSPHAADQRWYPTLETLQDGSMLILGGCRDGGYVNSANQDNPTYEFFPPRSGASIPSPILQETLPANLFPLTWLLPSGKILIQSNWATAVLDLTTNEEVRLDDVPDAVRVYPASAGNVMLPLTPANNWTATLLFCGGSNVQPQQWTASTFQAVNTPASTSCVRLTPDQSGNYTQDDPLPEARVMTNFIALPDGKILNINGAQIGTAGYGNDSWAVGHSYADQPVLTPAVYDPGASQGSRWSSAGLGTSMVPRMYHSSALLLPDGSVMISGSNPNPDYTVGAGVKYPTEYRTEIFYPGYFNQRRPQPQGLVGNLTYGGASFDVHLDAQDLFGDASNAKAAKVVVIRMGFSTHAMNMGQRYVQLASNYTAFEGNNTAILHVSQLPPNPAVIAPGPAYLFVVVNGVPSVGVPVMLGSGAIEQQKVFPVGLLPNSSVVAAGQGGGSATQKGGAMKGVTGAGRFWMGLVLVLGLM